MQKSPPPTSRSATPADAHVLAPTAATAPSDADSDAAHDTPPTGDDPASVAPYRGLRPYAAADSALFFGRRRLTARLADRVRAGARHLLLTGACGSGKTSLVQAGLVPLLSSLGVRPFTVAHPSLDPFSQLAGQGVSHAAEDLAGALRAAAAGQRALLILDHAEELATAPHSLARSNLLSQLSRVIEGQGTDAEVALLVLARSDEQAALLSAAPALLPLFEQPSVYVPATLELSEWMAIAREPVQACGGQLEPALLDALAHDIAALDQLDDGRPTVVLPHLAFVLSRLWQRRQGHTLRLADYEQIGGLRDALRRWADAAWQALPARDSARKSVLTLLAAHHAGARLVLSPRPLPLSEWRVGEPTAASSIEAAGAADLVALCSSGLLHIDEAADTVELIHPVLAQEWPLLSSLYEDEQRFVHWHRDMVTMVLPRSDPGLIPVADATLAPPPPSSLSGSRLAEAERWLGERPSEIDGAVRRLIEQSRVHALRPRGAAPALREAGSALPFWAAAGVVALLSVMALQRFFHHRQLARIDTDLASERGGRASLLVMQPGQDSAALALAIKAVAPSLRAGRPVPALAKEGLMTAYSLAKNTQPLHGHTDRVDSAVFDSAGKRVLTASTDRSARVWDARTGRQLLQLGGHRLMVTSTCFSPDDSRILTTSADGTARLWDATSGQLIHELRGHRETIEVGMFAPDGARVLTASHDGTARIWDARQGTLLRVLAGHGARVTAAAYSRDGRRIVTASWDHTARVWDAESGAPLRVLIGHTDRVNLATFGADADHIATGGWDQTARLWDLSRPPGPSAAPPASAPASAPAPAPASASAPAPAPASASAPAPASASGGAAPAAGPLASAYSILLDHGTKLQGLSYAPDGHWLATAGTDGVVKLWDGQTGTLRTRLTGHYGNVFGLDFAPDSLHFVSTGADRTVRLWDVRVERAVAVLYGHSGPIYTAAFSPSGSRVVTASYDQTARIWDVRAGQPLAIMQGHRRAVTSSAFSRDGTRIVTTSADHTARLWRWPGASEIAVLAEHSHSVNLATFSPDGGLIATASNDSDVRLWDGHTGKPLRILRGHRGPVYALAFSPSGDQLVSAGTDQVLRFWNPQTGAQTREVPGHAGNANWLTFSPDGRFLLSTGSEGDTWLRSPTTGEPQRSLRGHTSRVNRAEFFWSAGAGSGDLRLVTASSDRTVRIWDPNTGTTLNTLAGFADEVSSVAPSPDGRRLLIVSGEQGVRLWDVAAEMPLAVLPGFFEESVIANYAWPDGRYFIIASSDGLTKVYADDYPANLAGVFSDACDLLRYQREFERVQADCPPPN